MGALCTHTFLLVKNKKVQIMIASCERCRLTETFVFAKYPWRWLTISKDAMVNEGIRAREVRLIDQNGEQLGIKTKSEALEIAARAESRSCISCCECKTSCSPNYGLRKTSLRATKER